MANGNPESPWESVDPLGEALHSLRLSGSFYCHSDLKAPWGIDLPAMPGCLMFHIVTRGRCEVVVAEGGTTVLAPGDFALIPHGRGHVLRSDAHARTIDIFALPREQLSPRYERLRHGGDGKPTQVICGAVRVDDPAARQVVERLPELIRMDTRSPGNEWLDGLIEGMIAEAEAMRPGGDTVITRVSDLLVVQAIRHWLEHDPLARTGWLGALKDRHIGRAIALVHRHPTEPWSVDLLADRVGMSRSAFAARFTAQVGDTPMRYVRQWRFRVATTWLRDSDLPIAEMAARLGYESEASFNRAFKSFVGRTPGAVRREARRERPSPPGDDSR